MNKWSQEQRSTSTKAKNLKIVLPVHVKKCNSTRASAHKAKKRKEKPPKPVRTHCFHGHPWVEENIRKHNGYYECMTCHRERERTRSENIGRKRPKKVEGYCIHGHPLVKGNLRMNAKCKPTCRYSRFLPWSPIYNGNVTWTYLDNFEAPVMVSSLSR